MIYQFDRNTSQQLQEPYLLSVLGIIGGTVRVQLGVSVQDGGRDAIADAGDTLLDMLHQDL